MNAELMSARLQFQDSRDALFLSRLLAEIEGVRSHNAEVAQLVADVEKANGYEASVPLVNQATFLQMAYMTLVYPKQGVVGDVVGDWEPHLDWERVEVLADNARRFASAPDRWSQLLRTVRNALSHSTVEVGETTFTFTDEHGKSCVQVRFDWDFLGELTMEFFKAAKSALYPTTVEGDDVTEFRTGLTSGSGSGKK